MAEGARENIVELQRRSFFEEDLPYIRQRMQLLGITFDELKGATA